MRTALAACALVALALVARAADAPPPPLADAAAAFAHHLAAQLATVVRRAALLDPTTGGEDRAARQARLARQAELTRWFEQRGRSVQPAELRSDADRRNYQDFFAVMADADFLALPLPERRAAVARITDELGAMARVFPAALADFIAPPAAAAAPTPDPLAAALATRLTPRLNVQSRYFGREHQATVGALYLPATQTLYLNLNLLARDPAALVDGVEHELWHVLLPGLTPAAVADNLAWEGYTEALATWWGSAWRARAGVPAPPPGQESIEYPVPVAWCGLVLATDRRAALEWLAGLTAPADFAARLRAHPGPVPPRLADQFAQSLALPAARRQRLETLLHDWGWKEDDGSRFTLAKFVSGERLNAAALNQAFRADRLLLLDLIEAQGVVALQDLRAQPAEAEVLRAAAPLPPPLQRHVAAVLRYVREPQFQFGRR